jgi:hypothetical protein
VISDDEISQLEAVLAGTASAPLRPPAVLGRLAQLYLQAADSEQSAASPPAGGQHAGSEQARRALELAERGLAMAAPPDPLYPKLLHFTAAALRAVQPPPPGARGHDGRAARLDRDAWLLSMDPVPGDALQFARAWGDWAWRHEAWQEAAEAYEGAAFALARIVVRSTPGIMARLGLLSQYACLGPRSAFAYARLDRPKEAVTVLERSGGLLSAFGSQRRDLDRLAALGHPQLRDRVLAATRESAAQNEAQPDSYGHLPAAGQQVQAQLDALVREIRAIPEMTGFATPGGWADVSAAAQVRPVAYLAATDKGTVVLTVEQGAKNVSFACLPQTQQEIWSAVRAFFTAEYGSGPAGPHDELMTSLGWLSRIMLVTVQALGGDHPVLLVPSGLLAQLPLHAACGVFPAADGEPARTRFWFHPSHVAYADSARSWLACRERAQQRRGGGALVVNSPAPIPARFDDLQLSDYERDSVAKHFPVTELAGRDATAQSILDMLPAADIVHFSCHGQVDKRQHYTGVLMIADQHVITVRHLEDTAQLSARLVVLSACTSGMTAPGVAQLTSMPTALAAAGAAAVIATFWKTDEMATLLLVTRLYDLWQGGAAAGIGDALGQAQEWLAMSPASVLRAAVPAAALATRAGQRLAGCPDTGRPFAHPWFWTPFFLLGA